MHHSILKCDICSFYIGRGRPCQIYVTSLYMFSIDMNGLKSPSLYYLLPPSSFPSQFPPLTHIYTSPPNLSHSSLTISVYMYNSFNIYISIDTYNLPPSVTSPSFNCAIIN